MGPVDGFIKGPSMLGDSHDRQLQTRYQPVPKLIVFYHIPDFSQSIMAPYQASNLCRGKGEGAIIECLLGVSPVTSTMSSMQQ